MKDYFLIAKIVSVEGKNGFLRILPYSDFSDRFFKLKNIYVDFFGDKKELWVDEVKKNKTVWTLRIKNFFTEDDCALLIGKEIFVDSKDVIELPENTFFIHDLIGTSVFRNGVLIGKIDDVLQLPANDVYSVINQNGNEILIPALVDLIESYDAAEKIMILKPGDDLYDNDED